MPEVTDGQVDPVSLRVEVLTAVSAQRALQPGSRFALADIPAGITFDRVNVPGRDQPMIVYGIHTPMGIVRVVFDDAAAKAHRDRLTELLADGPRIEVARQMPPAM